ncbi:MAG TPA: hypothetical protein VFQ24_15695 [Terriglobia bacterium]|nr:hypothetical protein [Terriglobia bacterium]
MDKHDFSGIEVSAQELIVAVEREGRTIPLQCFANDAQGHQAVLRFLRGAGHRVRVCMESTGSTAWIWRWPWLDRGSK